MAKGDKPAGKAVPKRATAKPATAKRKAPAAASVKRKTQAKKPAAEPATKMAAAPAKSVPRKAATKKPLPKSSRDLIAQMVKEAGDRQQARWDKHWGQLIGKLTDVVERSKARDPAPARRRKATKAGET